MMFRFATLLLLVVPFVTSLCATEEFSDFIRLGHPDDILEGYDSSSNPDQSDNLKRAVAIHIPASQMIPCKGNYISIIKFAIAQNVYFSDNGLKVFITKDLNKPYDYEQTVTNIVSMWNQIPLTTPFHMDGEDVYIGYEYYASNKNGISRLTPNNDTSMDWCYQNGEWIKAQNNSALAIQGIVKGEQLPQYNITLNQTELLTYAELGKNMTLSGKFTNMGTATINSFNVNYRLNNGNWIAETIHDVDIPYENSYQFQTQHLSFPNVGEFIVEISVDELNGQKDIYPSDNVSSVYTVGCVNSFTPRNVLLEIFSTERCPNCPEGHKHLESVISGNPQIITVEHHAGFGSDKYSIQESLDYEWFYNGTLSAPSIMLDRHNQSSYNSSLSSNSPVFGATKLTTELMENALDIPAFATITLSIEYDAVNRNATFHVQGKRLLPLTGNNSKLFVFLTENNIYTDTQSGSAGKAYYHQHVLREVLTDTWGDSVDLNNGFTADYQTTIDETMNCDEMYAIAFVSNYNPNDVNNCSIYNTVQAKLTGNSSAIQQPTTMPISVINSGKAISIQGDYDSFKLFNLSGTCLKQSSKPIQHISTETLSKGVYLLQIQKQRANKTYKIILSN